MTSTGIDQKSDAGDVASFLSIVRNMTKRDESPEALRECESRYRLLLEHVPTVCWCMDGAGQPQYVSPNVERTTGFTPEEMGAGGCGRWFDRIHSDDLEKVISAFNGLIESGKRYDVDYRFQRKDDTWIWIHDQADSVVEVDEGKQAFGAFTDITDRKLAEERESRLKEEFHQTDKLAALGTLLSRLAHDMNNLATVVTLNPPMVQGIWDSVVPILDEYAKENGDFVAGGIDYSEMRELMPTLLSGLTQGAERIKAVIADLREFSKAGRTQPKSAVNLNDVVSSALKMINPHVLKATHCFSVECAQDLPTIEGHEQRLELVVINLIMNACQSLSSPEDGVSVRTYCSDCGDYACLLVEDEGSGMDEDMIRHIANPLHSARRQLGATGLGLSVAARIAKEHGGCLMFESEPARGTTALLRIPLVKK